jgi:hypothetical protein
MAEVERAWSRYDGYEQRIGRGLNNWVSGKDEEGLTGSAPPPSGPRGLSGTWQSPGPRMGFKVDSGGRPDGFPPYRPAAEQAVRYRTAMALNHSPVPDAFTYCRPGGIMWDLGWPFLMQYVQGDGVILQIFESWQDTRTIYLDRAHPQVLKPSYMGHSVGHWEDDTLVVDTIGFLPDTVGTRLDRAGGPHSDKLHIVERIRKVEGGRVVENVVTVEDPVYYTGPYAKRFLHAWQGGARMPNRDCELAMRGEIVNGLLVQ